MGGGCPFLGRGNACPAGGGDAGDHDGGRGISAGVEKYGGIASDGMNKDSKLIEVMGYTRARCKRNFTPHP